MTTDTIRSPEAIATLERIGSKPGTSHRDLLTITRRIVRHFWAQRRIIRSERQSLSRQANKLRQSGPFSQRRADALEQLANDHRADELENVLDVLEDYGRVLVLDREGYAKALGFEMLADLLNINRVDRERARRGGWFRLVDLVAIEGLENSAEQCGDGREFHSPLQLACVLALWVMRTRLPDQLPEPRTVDRARKGPVLIVHDASGSRLVER
ncbi:hypothetical protein SAMN05216229_106118 [Geopseudomonas sagittaria]|uniref:Uncharacterized protein n=1 Tax=Geopseudomonas sagittaria TaxID=1135990 RepID=A0A1I5THA8_9GAMM|nr:hypothetical protein [Pseudomonas sagittaria]SFP82462.1 hypothetical protein SAMN05216229_106118 [Pseudomonas sagittaria]